MIGKHMNHLVKEIRIRSKLNQEEFAKEIGTTVLSINRWENNKAEPNNMAQDNLLKFCEKHNIDIFDEVVKELSSKDTNSNILYHGSKKGLVGDIKPISSIHCDFGKGFYMGTDPSQPLTLICDEKQPVIYQCELDTSNLNILNIEVNLDWAMVIAYYRGYMDDIKGTPIYNKYANVTKGYDVVCGYIADDRMYKVMTRFFENEITDVALLNSLSVLGLGKQYVCITEKACKNVKILSQTKLNKFELNILENKSKLRRQDAVSSTEEILKKYRREGKYFDEIIKE